MRLGLTEPNPAHLQRDSHTHLDTPRPLRCGATAVSATTKPVAVCYARKITKQKLYIEKIVRAA